MAGRTGATVIRAGAIVTLFRRLRLATAVGLVRAVMIMLHAGVRGGLARHLHRTHSRLQRLRHKKENEQACDEFHSRILGY